MHFEYRGEARDKLTEILGDVVEFEDQLGNASAAAPATDASVEPLTPGLSGAAVFLVRRITERGALTPWVVKVARDAKLIIAERDNYAEYIRGRFTAAPALIATGSSRILLYEFGGHLASYSPQTLRSGYAASTPDALATLMQRIVQSLKPLHKTSNDTVSCVQRMTLDPPLERQVARLVPALPGETAARLVTLWGDAVANPERYPHVRSTGHGDLNAGNVLFEPGKGDSYPLFIDFASMRKPGGSPHHLPFWDYAKLERDLKTRAFLKEAIRSGLDEAAMLAVTRAVDAETAAPSAHPAVVKVMVTVRALRESIRKVHEPYLFDGCYRLAVAYATLLVFYRKEPDKDVALALQHRLAAESVIALLSGPGAVPSRVRADDASNREAAASSSVDPGGATAKATPDNGGRESRRLAAVSRADIENADAARSRSLRAYRERLAQASASLPPVTVLLARSSSLQEYYSSAGRPFPCTDEQYGELVGAIGKLAAAFLEVSPETLDWLATHGAYIHEAARDGASFATGVPRSAAAAKSRSEALAYPWENIARMLRTVESLLRFDADRVSAGFIEGEPAAHALTTGPVLAVACSPAGGGPGMIRVLDLGSGAAEAARLVARRKRLVSPRAIRGTVTPWEVFAHDGDYVYEWRPGQATPHRQYAVLREGGKAFMVSQGAGGPDIQVLTGASRLYRLRPDGASQAFEGLLRGSALVDRGAESWAAVVQVQQPNAVVFRLPQNDARSVITLRVAAVPFPGAAGAQMAVSRMPEPTELSSAAGGTLELSIPSDAIPAVADVQQAVNGAARVAIRFRSTMDRRDQHHLCVLSLDDPASQPCVATTPLRIFDARVASLADGDRVVTTLLPGGETRHCLAVWRPGNDGRLALESLLDPAGEGNATDLHLLAVHAGGFDLAYCYDDWRSKRLRSVQWPAMERSAEVGALPADAIEGESAALVLPAAA